tara:strand:+ start:196 stop:612 length:417 start_codon:yes stop_codon:yes gene_type:complete
MNKLIAKLDLKDYCNNRTTLKIHLLEDGQLSYGLASTKTGMGHSMSNLQIGFKNGSRLPDHIQDIEGFLKDHILNCIEDSVKTYLPDSYVTYHELEQEDDWDFEESIVNILGELKEYQKVTPQRNLQSAIKHLEQLVK